MGVSSSKIEEDKALTLCRERKRFVRQALDGRCSLAAAHVSYIQSLKNTGTALRKFVEPEVPVESSLYTSTSVTPEPVASTDKSLSQFSFSSPRSQRIESNETISQSTSPTHSGRFHVNYMRSGGGSYTVEERPPTSLTATVQSAEIPPSPRTPPPPENSPWDYFSLFDNQFSFTDGRGVSHHGLENVDDIGRLREEEGIPELEEERDNHSVNGRAEFKDSEDDFDEPSPEPLVQKYENRAASINSLNDVTSPVSSMANIAQDTPHLNGEKKIPESGLYETDETPDTTSPNATPPIVTLPNDDMKEIENVSVSEKKIVPKDFLLSVKVIEYLFVKSSESGKEFMRMLEANKVFFRPLHPERKASRSKVATYFTTFFVCCEEEIHAPQEPPSDTLKYLTWHRSASSLSSTSRIPLSSTTNDDLEDISHNMFSTSCMKSGSHASTLERLYAWERKLYDEVKACGIIRREYDFKCKQLRHQESRGESPYKIDKTRATVKDLYSRIRVAIQRIDSISKKIEELRDKELQPQLEELIGGLSRMWVMMLDCHKLQHSIISTAYINESFNVSIRSESHHQATIILEHELLSLCSSFTKWISAQKIYLQSINGWLLKCILLIPTQKKTSRKRNNVEFSPRRERAPPIFITCRDWLAKLEKLHEEEVAVYIKKLVAETNQHLPRKENKKADGDHVRIDTLREAPGGWNSAFNGFKLHLTDFINQLRAFAESSVKMYGELENSINEAWMVYEQAPYRS
ncbi:hypothetical protein QJS10_CPB17g01620 [Acorus calamus]|uniref:Uncharacterized protein n=1 Tax=Acorus calamus TaxID=4465 RepID=A0AAV9CVD9_ACOCL|nr:hypothetical protein QJS10_CPB17g01620 [Acorus calamus]